MPEVETVDAVLFSHLANKLRTYCWLGITRKKQNRTHVHIHIHFPLVYIAVDLVPCRGKSNALNTDLGGLPGLKFIFLNICKSMAFSDSKTFLTVLASSEK